MSWKPAPSGWPAFSQRRSETAPSRSRLGRHGAGEPRPPPPVTQFRRRLAVAFQAERPHIGQIALAAAFSHGKDMVGVPQAPAAEAAQTPGIQGGQLPSPAQTPDSPPFRYCIHTARRADAPITLEDSLAQVAGITAQFPFLHAPIRTERAASGWNFERTPAAQIPPALALFERTRVHAPASHGADGTLAGIEAHVVSV